MEETKPPKKRRKPRREKRSSKSTAITRVLTHPETGEQLILQSGDEYPDIFRYMAKVMFISGAHNIAQISTKLNIPAGTIRSWQSRESWLALKREVNRLATQDAVRASRTSMSKYIVEIDRGVNSIFERLNERLSTVEDKDKVRTESDIIKILLELWRIKLTIVRILTYGTESRGFTPHPADLKFDGLQDKKSAKQLAMSEAECILDNIPAYLREAANYVLAIEQDDIDPAMLDAVTEHIKASKPQEDDDDDDEDNFI